MWSEGGVDAGHARHTEHYRMEMDVTLDCGTDDFKCSDVNTKHNRTLKINQERKLGTEEQHNLSVCYIYGT